MLLPCSSPNHRSITKGDDRYNNRQMGQEAAKPQLEARYTSSRRSSVPSSASNTPISHRKPQPRVECEGLLKLRSTPFKNSIQIQTDAGLFFLQNVETTLKMLLQTRLNTNKLFMLEDIEKLIESISFTLAFLQDHHITYKDVSAENIYYDKGEFKLLPNQLIDQSTYQILRREEETYPSPELLIGLKLGEEDVEDEDILQKCNVFTFGMVLLEVATLLPSGECYDLENYQIIDLLLKERINQVEEYYGEKIARIIANMLDYDYTERMTLKELSIWVNRELAQGGQEQEQEGEQEGEQEPDPLVHSILAMRSEKATENRSVHSSSMVDKPGRRLTKNNSVYMGQNRENEGQREERNKIYVDDVGQNQYIRRGGPRQEYPYPVEQRQEYVVEKRQEYGVEKRQEYGMPKPRGVETMAPNGLNDSDHFKFPEAVKHELKHPNPYCQDFNFQQKQDQFLREGTKRIAKPPVNPYSNHSNHGNHQQDPFQDSRQYQLQSRQTLKELHGNQYYPKVEDIMASKSPPQQSMPDHQTGENGALSRIKEEILKSRRMLEQFRRGQS